MCPETFQFLDKSKRTGHREKEGIRKCDAEEIEDRMGSRRKQWLTEGNKTQTENFLLDLATWGSLETQKTFKANLKYLSFMRCFSM